MGIFLYLVKKYFFVTSVHRSILILEIGAICLVGVGIYLLISHFTGLINETLGKDFFKKLLARFKRGKKNEE